MDQKLIKFSHKLYDNKLPIYFDKYMPYLEARETNYNLRPHPLPVPPVAHAFTESCLLRKLVKIKNYLATYHNTHTHSAFSNYVVNVMIDKYSDECIFYPCHTYGRI